MTAQIIPLPEPQDRYGEPIKVPLPSMYLVQPISRIQDSVALSYEINPRHMKSACRCRSIAWPRQIAMFLAKELTHNSLAMIGHHFGDRDHSTVIHAIRAVEKRMAEDPIYRADVEALRGALS